MGGVDSSDTELCVNNARDSAKVSMISNRGAAPNTAGRDTRSKNVFVVTCRKLLPCWFFDPSNRLTAKKIDKAALYTFPTVFILFNTFYWFYYAIR